MKESFNFNELPEANKRYILEECLGTGVYGKVFKAKDTQADDKNVAIKIQPINDDTNAYNQEEYRILRDFSNHPNLPEFYGIFKSVNDDCNEIWLVLELCEGGPVIDLVKGIVANNRRMAEEHVAYIMKEVLKGLTYLHENKIMHRDIRASNVLLTNDGEIKLTDFGLSRILESTFGKTNSYLGAPGWMAPEIINTEIEGYDNRTDVWSLGILALELANGKSPYEGMHPTRIIFQTVRNPPPTLDIPANWSEIFKDFTSECLTKNPEHRPYMVELLEHPFITNVPENNYYLTQELKVLQKEFSNIGSEKRSTEVIIQNNLIRNEKTYLESMLVEDLSALNEINEKNILTEIDNRFQNGQCSTFIGDILLTLNTNEKTVYDEEINRRYQFKSRSDNAPHIYSVADSAYQAVLHHAATQHILLTGESASGKTTNYLHLIDHLLYLGRNNNINQERIKDAVKLLHAFVHASTPTNDYSTRCILRTEINYGESGKNTGARFEIHQIDKWRISSMEMDQPNFHMLYYFYDGIQATGQLNKYELQDGRNYRYLRISLNLICNNRPVEDAQKNAKKFERILEIFQDYEFSADEIESVCNILAAILNLGEIHFRETEFAEIEDEEPTKKVAQLLKIDVKKFIWALTNYCVVEEDSAVRKKHTSSEARNARDVLANTLYCRVIEYIVDVINNKLSIGKAIFGNKYSIKILDFYGFECFQNNNFPQFLVNCTNELLQYYYFQRVFNWEALETTEENVPYKPFHVYNSKEALEEMLGKSSVLALINEASRQGKSGKYINDCLSKKDKTFTKNLEDYEFAINHYAGKVKYICKEMPDLNKDFLPPEISEVLRTSSDSVIQQLFKSKLSRSGVLCISSKNDKKEVPQLQYSQTKRMRTTASTYKALSIELLKELSVGSGTGGIHFVRCVRSDLNGEPKGFNKELIRHQLKAMAVLETTEARKKGFPHRIAFSEFLRRYKFLAFDFDENVEISRDNCRLLLIRLKMEGWIIGETKVFLKYYNEEYLSRLYETQVKKIIKIQSMIRSYLVKRKLIKKLRTLKSQVDINTPKNEKLTEEEAARVVQKAYRKYTLKKARGELTTDDEKLDEDAIEFIREYANKWRSKTIFQVLLQYRAARYQDMHNLAHQVHFYNQNIMNYLTQCEDVDVERVDSRAQIDTWLGDKKPTVLKLPFRLEDVPYFDTSYMCDPLITDFKSASDKEDESWDAPFRWRETILSQITDAIQVGNLEENKYENKLIELPYNRNPSEPVVCLVSLTEELNEEEAEDIDKTDSVLFNDSDIHIEKYEFPKDIPESVQSDNRDLLSPGLITTASANKDFEFIRPKSPILRKPKRGTINPIIELEIKGRKQNISSDDEPPFNFQAMLRKTNIRRDSLKREYELTEKFVQDNNQKNIEDSLDDSSYDTSNVKEIEDNENIESSQEKLENIEISTNNEKHIKDTINEAEKNNIKKVEDSNNTIDSIENIRIPIFEISISDITVTTEIGPGIILEGTVIEI